MRTQYQKLPIIEKTSDSLIWRRLPIAWRRGDPIPERQLYEEEVTTDDESDSSDTYAESEWDELMEEHEGLEAQLEAFPTRPYSFTSALGSYVLRCRDPELRGKYAWPDICTLDISLCPGSRGLIAAFDLGNFEGTMLMATSQSGRKRICHEQSTLNVDEKDNDAIASDNVEKKLAEASHKQKTTKAISNTRYLREVFVSYRCREKKPCHYARKAVFQKDGWVNFRDNRCLGFKGLLSLPMVSGNNRVVFDGYKINREAVREGQPWASYDTKHIKDGRVSK
jgi:hypothetical protein